MAGPTKEELEATIVSMRGMRAKMWEAMEEELQGLEKCEACEGGGIVLSAEFSDEPDYGWVVLTKGERQGFLGLYEDDDPDGVIVYLMFREDDGTLCEEQPEAYRVFPRDWIREARPDEIPPDVVALNQIDRMVQRAQGQLVLYGLDSGPELLPEGTAASVSVAPGKYHAIERFRAVGDMDQNFEVLSVRIGDGSEEPTPLERYEIAPNRVEWRPTEGAELHAAAHDRVWVDVRAKASARALLSVIGHTLPEIKFN